MTARLSLTGSTPTHCPRTHRRVCPSLTSTTTVRGCSKIARPATTNSRRLGRRAAIRSGPLARRRKPSASSATCWKGVAAARRRGGWMDSAQIRERETLALSGLAHDEGARVCAHRDAAVAADAAQPTSHRARAGLVGRSELIDSAELVRQLTESRQARRGRTRRAGRRTHSRTHTHTCIDDVREKGRRDEEHSGGE